eukprot:CAMPEP_0201881546 /NCGR_PEP_ID=MMETSP0902-20130614/11826_1 /ASSEMBLY_ACC=CAM_ASM_000551 /TAXON_ID=420261 /ORGANISM="Thalassiosira antarctica, Strain CCMP982" /LENGTH=189 /DNA_ID=CAMNT_0048409777 /DNA_START=42 /DNA_END=608 /DNA_ORIENTATION=+
MRIKCPTSAALLAAATSAIVLIAPAPSDSFSPTHSSFKQHVVAQQQHRRISHQNSALQISTSTPPPGIQNQPTELPDSLSDAASIAANACQQLSVTSGTTIRCRVDFDTSIGDETYTTLKSSTEFTQQFVSSLCLASIKGVMEWKQDGVMKLIQAKTELREVREKMTEMGLNDDDDVDFGEYPGDESTT